MISIPKVFHRIWLGGKPMPDEYVRFGESWLKHHPGWETRLWTEDAFKKSKFVDLLERCSTYAMQANILRVELLHAYGGVYVDTDFECLRSLEPLIDDVGCFATKVYDDAKHPHFVANGIGGATPGHPAMQRLLDAIRPAFELGDLFCVGPVLWTKLFKEAPDVRLLEKRLFYPYSLKELEKSAGPFPEAYAVHHWGAIRNGFSWRPGLPGVVGRASIPPGWMNGQELEWLAREAAVRKTIVEIGSWKGRSSKALAGATQGKVFCVDHWRGNEELKDETYTEALKQTPDVIFREFSAHLADEIASGKAVPVRASSVEAVPILKGLLPGGKAEMIFIDGDHSYESVKRDIESVLPLLADGGLLCGHDYGVWPGVRQAVDEAFPGRVTGGVCSIWVKT